MAVAQKYDSLESFLQMPEEEPALEYENGVITQKVSPKTPHSALHGSWFEHLTAAGRPKQVARAFIELRVTFGGQSVVPDISVFVWDRIQRSEDGLLLADVTIPPDIAIEIASPGQTGAGLTRRCLWYAANDVRIALLTDPVDLSILAFRPNQPIVVWQGKDRIDLSDILPDFELTAEELFAALR